MFSALLIYREHRAEILNPSQSFLLLTDTNLPLEHEFKQAQHQMFEAIAKVYGKLKNTWISPHAGIGLDVHCWKSHDHMNLTLPHPTKTCH